MRLRFALTSLAVTVLMHSVVCAQTKPKPGSGAEAFDVFKDFKPALTLKQGHTEILNAMKAGNVNLDPPSAADSAVLMDTARYYIYPITQPETYIQNPSGTAELAVPNYSTPSVTKILTKLQSQLVIVGSGQVLPVTQVAYAREFGASCVKVIDEVFAKSPPPIVRVNAMRVLALVAESGAPATWTKTIEMLTKRNDKDFPLDLLYYGLQAADNCLATYDAERGLIDKNWVKKKTYFELVTIVNDVITNVPPSIIGKTYLPESSTQQLTTAKSGAPGELRSEQVASVQAFRLIAVRALAKVRNDVIKIEAGPGGKDQEIRPLYTLARIAVSDTTLIARPSTKEYGDALLGLGNMVPSDVVDPDVLAAVLTRATLDFGAPRLGDQSSVEKGTPTLNWKIYGARLEARFQAWEKGVQSSRCKLPKDSKDMLVTISQTMVRDYFTPMAKAGTITSGNVQEAFDAKSKIVAAKTSNSIFTDLPKLTFNGTGK